MKELPNVTLCCIDTHFYGESISAIKKSLQQIKPEKTLFLTDISAYNPNFPFEIVKIPKIASKQEYSRFVIKELGKYITTKYVLIIQHDGYVLDAEQWDDKFLEYDYIGAPWLETDGYNVGNGGFSLRTKKIMDLLAVDGFILPLHPEDSTIARLYRPYLEKKYQIQFAPESLAEKFSFELREPSQKTFGFHGKFHPRFKPTIVVRRQGALGDIIATEPLLEYYHKKGYNVAIDMPVHLCMYFGMHHFPVKHISQLDGRIPTTVIDLDMAYENNPKQLHLKSYYDVAGVPEQEREYRNPRLKFPIDESNKLFKKYVVIHTDFRDQESRNVYGIFWPPVIEYLKEQGYDVFQVGHYEHEKIFGAIEMTTQTTQMLLYLVAGADLFIGVDSGVSNMAVACNVKSIIFAGSVNPEYIYPDHTNIKFIHNHGKAVCEKPFCWHETVGSVEGTPCYLNEPIPPCVKFSNDQLFEALNDFI